MSFNSFDVKSWFDFERELKARIVNEIKGYSQDYLLNTDQALITYKLKGEYTLIPISVNPDGQVSFSQFELYKKPIALRNRDYNFSEWIDGMFETENFIRNKNDHYSRTLTKQAAVFIARYSFTGSPALLEIRPSTYKGVTYEIANNGDGTISLSFDVYNYTQQDYTDAKNISFNKAFGNLDYLNQDVTNWNNSLTDFINNAISQQKNKYITDNNFLQSIEV